MVAFWNTELPGRIVSVFRNVPSIAGHDCGLISEVVRASYTVVISLHTIELKLIVKSLLLLLGDVTFESENKPGVTACLLR